MKKNISIITVNQHHFVCGLTWKILPEPRHPKKQMRLIGKAEGMDLVAFRKALVLQQAGFLSKKQAAAPGMFSLALVLASILGNHWIGIFQLPDTQGGEKVYAFVAVLDGNIVPQSDFVGSQEAVLTAKKRLQSILKESDLCPFYAPKDLDPEAEEKSLQELLIAKKLTREYQIKSLTWRLSQKTVIRLGMTITLLLSLGLAIKQWNSLQLERRQRALLTALDTQEAPFEQKGSALPSPLDQTSSIHEMIHQLYQALYQAPISIAGWIYTHSKCQQGSITYSYQRSQNSTVTLEAFIEMTQKKYPVEPHISHSDTGETVEFTLPVAMEIQHSHFVNEWAPQLKKVISLFQKNKIKATFSSEEEADYLPDHGQISTDVLPLKKQHFTYETEIPPHLIFKDNSLHRVRLSSIKTTLNPESGRLYWSIEGDIYGQ
jgi:Pilin accessory protein (PilO)